MFNAWVIILRVLTEEKHNDVSLMSTPCLFMPPSNTKKGARSYGLPPLEFLPGRRRDSNSGPIDEEKVVPIAI